MKKEKVIEWMPAKMTFSCAPEGWTLCHSKAVQNENGASGALFRNNNTGRYQIYAAGVFSMIDQEFAKKISEAE